MPESEAASGTRLTINGTSMTTDAAPDTPLLWVLRDHLGLTGTKFGCGQALCGACTVHVEGQAVRSCAIPLADVAERAITTIEGLGATDLHPLQKAWIDHQVPQCGYCQPGFIMAAAALLNEIPTPDDTAIQQGITNLCRCGTYSRIRAAIRDAAVARRS
jgi:aerobic-type carbon monoxide dehydrogenase small subunit (CoxS/CutS family)